jgi:hypothetical protein
LFNTNFNAKCTAHVCFPASGAKQMLRVSGLEIMTLSNMFFDLFHYLDMLYNTKGVMTLTYVIKHHLLYNIL